MKRNLRRILSLLLLLAVLSAMISCSTATSGEGEPAQQQTPSAEEVVTADAEEDP